MNRTMGRRWLMVFMVATMVVMTPALTAVAQGRSSGPQSWLERAAVGRSRHYVIHSDLPADEVREYARHLDIVYQAYLKRLGSLRQRGPQSLNVYLFAKRQDYLDTLQSAFGVNGAGSGGMFFVNSRGNGLAIWTEGLPRRRVEHVMQHEGFHQVAHALFGGDLPVWANEGLAEFFGEAVVVGNDMVIGQINPRTLQRLRDAIEKNEYIPFRTMLSMTGETWNAAVTGGSAQLQYQQAWSMVQFLVYGDNGRYQGAFEKYLHAINAGYRSYDAWVRAFGDDNLTSFEARWRDYILRVKPTAFITALERIEFLAAGMQELTRRGTTANTLDTLRDELRAIDFAYNVQSHGFRVTHRASDDALFEIPMDDLARVQPAFTVERKPRRLPTLRERRLEEQHPTPADIFTAGLKPHDLRVMWVRDKDDPSVFTYEIVVQR